MEIIDLRSDTVTQPTPEMRQAMAEAPVGDDVYGEDPTVNRLQELAARLMGKEASLFVPSGTMGNLLAMLTTCNRGDEVIMGNLSHAFRFECGGAAALGGIQPMIVSTHADGTLDLENNALAFREEDIHQPTTRMILLENTHNLCGGVPLSVEYTRWVGEYARDKKIHLHLDGARIFNAAIALDTEAKDLSDPADSVTFCLSKGLGAPVGSMLCGTEDFIDRARRIRKQLGGGMRQAGILAAAGIVALEQMIDRLQEDHERAKRLAEELRGVAALDLGNNLPRTNMLYINLIHQGRYSAAIISCRLEEFGIKVDVEGPYCIRMVTHIGIDDAAIDRTIRAFHTILG